MDLVMVASSVLFAALFAMLGVMLAVVLAARCVGESRPRYAPQVSVVIPAYNESRHIAACIEGVLKSAYSSPEVIVVDDGSSDDTVRVVRGYAGVRVVRTQHLGKVAALNAGVKTASRELVVTVDADTVVDPDCIRGLVAPLRDPRVAATTGCNHVANRTGILAAFQAVEYPLLNLIATSFSRLFGDGIWFFGSVACFRKSALLGVGGFKAETRAEDADIMLELKQAGYRTINVAGAIAATEVPTTLVGLYRQRCRWWVGSLQALVRRRLFFTRGASFPVRFAYVSHLWWSFYALVSLPVLAYQIQYWFPASGHAAEVGSYLFKWFTLYGPLWVLANIPSNGVSLYNIFGVLSGIMTTALSLGALKQAAGRFRISHLAAIFLYFPYTIVLNTIILVSLATNSVSKKSSFVR